MDNRHPRSCQWTHCDASAIKHVVVGLRVFDAADDIHISEMPYNPEHFDVCEKHLGLARLQYVHVAEYEPGECPACSVQAGSE